MAADTLALPLIEMLPVSFEPTIVLPVLFCPTINPVNDAPVVKATFAIAPDDPLTVVTKPVVG